MRQVATSFSVPQGPDQVWSVLTDYASYGRWNSFMIAASGDLVVGKTISITISPAAGKELKFKPTLLVLNANRELRWRGRLIVKGLFDGEHYWTLARNEFGGTDVSHGETFTGLLVSIVKPETFQAGFERMNHDMAVELDRRFR